MVEPGGDQPAHPQPYDTTLADTSGRDLPFHEREHPCGIPSSQSSKTPPCKRFAPRCSECFAAQAHLVREAGCVAVVQYRLVEGLKEALAIRVLELPFEAVPIREAFWWDSSLDSDSGHLWLRQQLRAAAEVWLPSPSGRRVM